MCGCGARGEEKKKHKCLSGFIYRQGKSKSEEGWVHSREADARHRCVTFAFAD